MFNTVRGGTQGDSIVRDVITCQELLVKSKFFFSPVLLQCAGVLDGGDQAGHRAVH